jgi:hypothetical protein
MKNLKRYEDYFQLNEARIDTTDFEYVDHLGGSTGADLYEDSNGNKWVVKSGNHIEQMWNEYVANKVYAKFGIDVPEAYIGEMDGRKVFVMEYLESSVPLGEVDLSTVDVDKGFIFDVLTANWDVVGTTYDLDNIRVKDGKAYRVDLGGTLLYRAQGAAKGKFFGHEPSEHKTLRDSNMNYQTAKVFQNIDDEYIKDSIRDIMKSYVVEDKINHRAFLRDIYNIIFDEDNGMHEEEKSKLYKTLGRRALKMYDMFH